MDCVNATKEDMEKSANVTHHLTSQRVRANARVPTHQMSYFAAEEGSVLVESVCAEWSRGSDFMEHCVNVMTSLVLNIKESYVEVLIMEFAVAVNVSAKTSIMVTCAIRRTVRTSRPRRSARKMQILKCVEVQREGSVSGMM